MRVTATPSSFIHRAVKKVTKHTVYPAIKIAVTPAITPAGIIPRAVGAHREAVTAFITIAAITTPPLSRWVSAIEASIRTVWSQTAVATRNRALIISDWIRISSKCCSRIPRIWQSAWIRSSRRDFWKRIHLSMLIIIIVMGRAIILKRLAVRFKAMPRLQFCLRKRKGWAAVIESKRNRHFVVKIIRIRDKILTLQLSSHLHSSLLKRQIT